MKKTQIKDIYNKNSKFNKKYDLLTKNKLFKHPENNKIIKIYIDAKIKGHYSRLKYDVNKPKITCLTNLEKLEYLETYFNKPFTTLTQEDIDKLQIDLDQDNLLTINLLHNQQNRPLSYNTKKDLIKNIKQFWKFYQLYTKEELNKKIDNITEYLRLKEKPEQEIDYLTHKEFLKLIQATKNTKQKLLLCLAFETSARPIEILNLKRKDLEYDEETKQWTIKLPNIKGKSSNKLRIQLDSYSDVVTKYLTETKIEPEDYLINYTYPYFRKLVYKLGKEQLNRNITPRIFRKSHTMYMINQGLPEQYIKAHNGWTSDSQAITHYINQKGIKKPDHIRNKIKQEAHQDTETQIQLMKAQLQQQANLLKTLQETQQKQLEQAQQLNIKNEIEKKQLIQLLELKKQNKK